MNKMSSIELADYLRYVHAQYGRSSVAIEETKHRHHRLGQAIFYLEQHVQGDLPSSSKLFDFMKERLLEAGFDVDRL